MIAEDQLQLTRFLDQGKPIRLKINVQNKVSGGPVDSANVVVEIRGSEHPEQVIVVGGHLDSWDLADGATDDGCGVATTLGAAKAIKLSGFKPNGRSASCFSPEKNRDCSARWLTPRHIKTNWRTMWRRSSWIMDKVRW